MANSVDPDQTAPIGAVCSGSTLFASILKLVSNVRQLFAADDFSRRHNQMHFFLGALWVKLGHGMRNLSSVLTTRSYPNQPTQLQSLARKVKFHF